MIENTLLALAVLYLVLVIVDLWRKASMYDAFAAMRSHDTGQHIDCWQVRSYAAVQVLRAALKAAFLAPLNPMDYVRGCSKEVAEECNRMIDQLESSGVLDRFRGSLRSGSGDDNRPVEIHRTRINGVTQPLLHKKLSGEKLTEEEQRILRSHQKVVRRVR